MGEASRLRQFAGAKGALAAEEESVSRQGLGVSGVCPGSRSRGHLRQDVKNAGVRKAAAVRPACATHSQSYARVPISQKSAPPLRGALEPPAESQPGEPANHWIVSALPYRARGLPGYSPLILKRFVAGYRQKLTEFGRAGYQKNVTPSTQETPRRRR